MSVSEGTVLPQPLRGTKEGTFVYITIKDRWPTIVSKLVDYFHTNRRYFLEKYGDGAEEDLKSILAALSELRYRMMTNKSLLPLEDKFDDVEMWNKLLEIEIENAEKEERKSTWYDSDWLFVECYLYRRIYGYIYSTKLLKSFDYFGYQKNTSFTNHKCQIIDSLVLLKSHLSVSNLEADELHLSSLIKQSIWGNRADLSLSGGEHFIHNQDAEALTALDNYLIVNDLPRVLLAFRKIKHKEEISRRVDIILDNAGLELASDMVLIEYLLASGWVHEVVVHIKAFPWFVSDVTMEDWFWTCEAFKLFDDDLSFRFGSQMERRIKNGTIKLKNHLFWTSPHAFCDMKQFAPDLYEDLGKSHMLIFKGDLNYRKLVGDRDWPYTTPFKTAIRGFEPAPFVALRTLKAETVAGLSPEVVNHLHHQFGNNNDWLVKGTHAVIQYNE